MTTEPRTWVIVGCGYTGSRLARSLLEGGDRVVATRRSTGDLGHLDSPIEKVALDIASAARDCAGLPLAGAIVVDSIPPSTDDGSPERELVKACIGGGAARFVYLSSTGVYAGGDGGWTDEDSPTGPIGERGRRRLAAESVVLATARALAASAVSLRIAAIYGPGRGVHARLRRGDYSVYGPGTSPVSRIHVDDLVAAIIAAAIAPTLTREVYCVADDEPTGSRPHADGVAAMLGMEPPPERPLESASAAARAMLNAGRRVSNRRLKSELGVVLSYPSWREGTAQAIAEEPWARS